jgi:hypothetical protein
MILSLKNSKLKLTGGYNILEPILKKRIFSTIASGATTIGSAGRAPDDVGARKAKKELMHVITTIRSEFLLIMVI